MIVRVFAAWHAFTQPLLTYCPNCAGHFPPSHFPCG